MYAVNEYHGEGGVLTPSALWTCKRHIIRILPNQSRETICITLSFNLEGIDLLLFGDFFFFKQNWLGQGMGPLSAKELSKWM